MERITNPKEIKVGASAQFSALLKIDKKTENKNYLCTIGIEGFIEGAEEYTKELTIQIN